MLTQYILDGRAVGIPAVILARLSQGSSCGISAAEVRAGYLSLLEAPLPPSTTAALILGAQREGLVFYDDFRAAIRGIVDRADGQMVAGTRPDTQVLSQIAVSMARAMPILGPSDGDEESARRVLEIQGELQGLLLDATGVIATLPEATNPQEVAELQRVAYVVMGSESRELGPLMIQFLEQRGDAPRGVQLLQWLRKAQAEVGDP